jgi:hypothetical protein
MQLHLGASRKRPAWHPRSSARRACAADSLPPKFGPLYLFHCGMEWHSTGDTGAGWELVQAMRSGDRGARALAAELLAETENGRLLVRDLRRTRTGLREIAFSPDGQFRFKNHGQAEA